MNGKYFSGRRLVEMRERLHWNQGDLARNFAGGRSQGQISMWESGSRIPNTNNALLLAQALHCNVEDLYSDTPELSVPRERASNSSESYSFWKNLGKQLPMNQRRSVCEQLDLPVSLITIIVEDAGLSPVLNRGDIAVIDKDIQPHDANTLQSGQLLAADMQGTIRFYELQQASGSWYLMRGRYIEPLQDQHIVGGVSHIIRTL